MRHNITPTFVQAAPPPADGAKYVIYWDTTQAGFGLLVTKDGHRSFVVQYRAGVGRGGKNRRTTLKRGLSLNDARREAKKIAGDVAKGLDPVAEKRAKQEEERAAEEAAKLAVRTTVKAIIEDYMTQVLGISRDAEGNAAFDGRKRSAPEQLRVFEQHVYPEIAEEQIEALKRTRIVQMLDKIEKNSGPVMADRTLAYLRAALNWYAARTDDFKSPIVRGMARTKPKEREGTRTLTDDEIRDLWTALDMEGKDIPACYPRYVRSLLLTALRRREASNGVWGEIDTLRRDDFEGLVWTIPGSRMKNKRDHAVPLTAEIIALFGERPKTKEAKTLHLYSTTGGRQAFSGFSKAKAAIDARIAKLRKEEGRQPMEPWTLHDLRRTAKTLMGRAQVRPDISERVLAHTIGGVAGIYDRYGYLADKLDAIAKLATLVDRIVHPRANVTEISSRAAAG